MIKPFSETRKEDLMSAGGKGCQLGELYNLGLPVPEGFILTTDSYSHFIDQHELKDKILQIIKKIDFNTTESLDRYSKEIRELIQSHVLPKEVEDKVIDHLKPLKTQNFAVRSSATAEDLPKASFAGQQDTYLSIDRAHIPRHIIRCWASLYTSRAIFYRNENNIAQDISMAVVIQEMVQADYAGVMFTLDPIKKTHLLVELASGLGEKVVSGSVTPNSYFLDKKTLEITQKQEEEPIELSIPKRIAQFGLKIEEHYQTPQDIEFAVKDGKVYILQSRPITA